MLLSRSAAQHCLPRWSSAATSPPLQTSKMFWLLGGTSPSARTLCWSTTPQASGHPLTPQHEADEELLVKEMCLFVLVILCSLWMLVEMPVFQVLDGVLMLVSCYVLTKKKNNTVDFLFNVFQLQAKCFCSFKSSNEKPFLRPSQCWTLPTWVVYL